MDDKKRWVLDPDRFEGAYCLTVMSDGVHCDYNGRTLDELRKDNDNPNLQALRWSETSNVLKAYEQKLQQPFEEISQERFNRMLNELPPARMIQDGFFYGEACFATLYPFYFTRHERYYFGVRDIQSSDAMILAEIDKCIGK